MAAKTHVIELDFPRSLLVQGGMIRKQITGIGDPPYVAKVDLLVVLSTKARALELSLIQARELMEALQAAIGEAEQVTEERNQKEGGR